MRHLLEPTVTSTGQALIGNVDPEVLEPITFSVNLEHLQGYLNFAAENARQALNELSSVISDDSRPNGPTGNALIRPLRMFFGELNSAIELALRLTAAKVGFQLPFDGVNWEMFAEAWKLHGIKPETLDDLKRLGFDWDGINLFEIRTYAKQATQGVLHVQCAVRYLEGEVPAERLVACMLSPCRKGGGQIPLPDGLERYFDAARRFSQRLLNLAWQQATTEE